MYCRYLPIIDQDMDDIDFVKKYHPDAVGTFNNLNNNIKLSMTFNNAVLSDAFRQNMQSFSECYVVSLFDTADRKGYKLSIKQPPYKIAYMSGTNDVNVLWVGHEIEMVELSPDELVGVIKRIEDLMKLCQCIRGDAV